MKLYKYFKEKFSWFIYLYIKKPYWNLKLVFDTNFSYIPWECFSSLVDYTFAQFKNFYEKYPEEFHDGSCYLENTENSNDEEYKRSMKLLAEDSKRIQQEAYNIYKYITVSRKSNDELLHQICIKSLNRAIERVNSDDPYVLLTEDLATEIYSWSVDDTGRVIDLSVNKLEEGDSNFIELFTLIEEKLDEEFAIRILKIRNYLST